MLGDSTREDDLDSWDDLPNDEIVDPDEFGGLVWFGVPTEDPTDGEGKRLSPLIQRWRKSKTCKTFVVTIPNDQVDEFVALMMEHKWKVLK